MTAVGTLDDVALFRQVPELRARVRWARLGRWPTPVEPLRLDGAADLYVKREDVSSPIYGGNKIRTLEAMFGVALAEGAERIWATGAYGSNHTVATLLHAPVAGLTAGAALWPQPRSTPARENLSATLSARPALRDMVNAVELPFAMAGLRRAARRTGARDYVMAPGGATPAGAFGALSAALEVAEQIAAGDCPAVRRVVLAVGSTCTTAGLLAGFHIAYQRGALDRIPAITAVRVTPWPITSTPLILRLSLATVRRFERLTERPTHITYGQLASTLHVETRFFGGGYGHATATGCRATAAFERAGGPPLDVVYSSKAGAAVVDLARHAASGPILFWATKSSAPLPVATPDDVARAPRAMRVWLGDV